MKTSFAKNVRLASGPAVGPSAAFGVSIGLMAAVILLGMATGIRATENNPSEENLLTNSALEGDSGVPYDWDLPIHAAPAPPPGEVDQDANAGQTGKSCLRITHRTGEDHYTQVRQVVSVSPGGKYAWRARIKTENLVKKVPEILTAAVGVYTPRGDTISFERADTLGEWQDVGATFEVPADIDKIQFLIYFDAQEGTFWVEQPVIVPVE